jgi:dethiobiotin synthetase
MLPVFITGIGTGVGKTIVAAIVTEALKADYWKPIQSGMDEGTDSLQIQQLISNPVSVIHKEAYALQLPASPHIAARKENIKIDLNLIVQKLNDIKQKSDKKTLVIEGAGGIMVPLNENEFILDLIQKMECKVILVSRNYLGSINHSLLTAAVCKQRNIDVAGWIFNDQYLNYEEEIERWAGFRKIASIPNAESIDKRFIKQQANQFSAALTEALE